MYPDTTGSGRESSSEDGGCKRWRAVGGGGEGKKNHYTARGWKGCHKEFHYFSSGLQKVDCAYCNFPPCIHEPLNNLGSFRGRSFPFPPRSLPRVQGRGAQSPRLKETLTHRNTPCHYGCHLLLLLLLPPVLPNALYPLPLYLPSLLLPSTAIVLATCSVLPLFLCLSSSFTCCSGGLLSVALGKLFTVATFPSAATALDKTLISFPSLFILLLYLLPPLSLGNEQRLNHANGVTFSLNHWTCWDEELTTVCW